MKENTPKILIGLATFLVTSIGCLGVFSFVSADTQVLLPSGVGSVNDASFILYPNSGEARWQDIDDYPADASTTYLKGGSGTYIYTSVQLQNPTTTDGTINSVTVVINVKDFDASGDYAKPGLYLSGATQLGTERNLDSVWTEYSEVIARPTGGSWSWTDIENLEAEIGLNSPVNYAAITQLYVVVDYTPETIMSTSTSPSFLSERWIYPFVFFFQIILFFVSFVVVLKI